MGLSPAASAGQQTETFASVQFELPATFAPIEFTDGLLVTCSRMFNLSQVDDLNNCREDIVASFGFDPPTLVPLNEAEAVSILKRADEGRTRLLGFVCGRIAILFGGDGKETACNADMLLSNNVRLTGTSNPNSVFPEITIELAGPSLQLAARLDGYWELHRISLQFVPASPDNRLQMLMIAAMLKSMREKNASAMSLDQIVFSAAMPEDDSDEVSIFLNRIVSQFGD